MPFPLSRQNRFNRTTSYPAATPPFEERTHSLTPVTPSSRLKETPPKALELQIQSLAGAEAKRKMLVLWRPRGCTWGREAGVGAPWPRRAGKARPKACYRNRRGRQQRGSSRTRPTRPLRHPPAAGRTRRGRARLWPPAEGPLAEEPHLEHSGPGRALPCLALPEASSRDRWSCGLRGHGPAARLAMLSPGAAQTCPALLTLELLGAGAGSSSHCLGRSAHTEGARKEARAGSALGGRTGARANGR